MDTKIKILGFGGSLRKDSYSCIVMHEATNVCPDEAEYEIFDGLGEFPPFNQDIDPNSVPIVKTFKEKIKAADALLISTPEYNRSIPGYLKNAIDWASRPYGDNSFAGKPAAIMSSSTGLIGGALAQYALRQTMVFLDVHALNKPEVMISNIADKVKDGKVVDENTKEHIHQLMQALISWTRQLEK